MFNIIVFALCYSLAGKYFDLSWDGQWYHQESVIRIIEGWNPLLTDITQEQSPKAYLWISHYPQGAWIIEASVYAFGNSIQSAKLLGFLLIITVFIYSLYTLSKIAKFSILQTLLLSLLIAFNPIAFTQLFSYYIDGVLGLLLALLILSMITYCIDRSRTSLIQICFVIVLLCSVKFTGFVYAAVFTFFFVLYLFYDTRFNFKKILPLITILAVCFLFALSVPGYGSYLRNTIDYKHPIYPLMGPGNVGHVVADLSKPANFMDMNRFEKLFVSTLSKPVWSHAPLNSTYKRPFRDINMMEFRRVDTELGGFGPLWLEVVIIAFIPLLIIFFWSKKHRKLFIFLAIAVLSSILINEESYNARYVPQIWYLPVLVLTFFFIQGRKKINWIGLLFGALMMYNTVWILFIQINWNEEQSKLISEELIYLRNKEEPIKVHIDNISTEIKLKEYGIEYEIIPDTDYPNKRKFVRVFENDYYLE